MMEQEVLARQFYGKTIKIDWYGSIIIGRVIGFNNKRTGFILIEVITFIKNNNYGGFAIFPYNCNLVLINNEKVKECMKYVWLPPEEITKAEILFANKKEVEELIEKLEL